MTLTTARFGAAFAAVLLLSANAARAEPWPAPEPRGDDRACIVEVFMDADYRGEQARFDEDQPYVGDHWNDRISSVKVIAGIWEFYFDASYRGETFRTGPGWYPYVGDHWNDQISSFRCMRPTEPRD